MKLAETVIDRMKTITKKGSYQSIDAVIAIKNVINI
jgi:hypothetical protein